MSVQIKGAAELQRFLDQLPANVEKNIVRGALRAGTKVLADAVNVAVPERTGALKGSIKVRAGVRAGRATARVTIGDKKAWYLHIIEGGSKPHDIAPKKRLNDGKKALAFGDFVRALVHHPGTKANPFFVRTVDANAQRASDAVIAYIRNRLKTKHGMEVGDA
jgi:HK97 gp10 family phage protein